MSNLIQKNLSRRSFSQKLLLTVAASTVLTACGGGGGGGDSNGESNSTPNPNPNPKPDPNPNPKPNPNQPVLKGMLYWSFAGEMNSLQLETNYFMQNRAEVGASAFFDSFDISQDKTKILLPLDVEGTYNFDERRFVLRTLTDHIKKADLNDGKTLKDITYEWDHISTTTAYLSPNEKYIALEAQHFADMPIVILELDTGREIATWRVPNVSFLNYGKPVWTNDNTLYFRIANKLYKCSPQDNYQSAPKILDLPEDISNVTVNPQGTMIAYRKDRHLWLSNIDGSNAKQITTSQTSTVIEYDGETQPAFSPDGNYIVFTGSQTRGAAWSDHDYPDGSWVSGVGGKFGYIMIILADGKLYDLEKKGSGVILMNAANKPAGLACSGNLIWR